MDGPHGRFRLLQGGAGDGQQTEPALDRADLRVIDSRTIAEFERALVEAVEAARQIRLEIERRIARALESFEDGRA